MTVGFLATGDEVIQGDVLNTNTHYLAHILNSEGLDIGVHVTCSDDELEICHCLAFLAKEHDIVIISGGLGPTSDDKTRYALSRYLKAPLLEFSEAINHIQSRLTQGNRTLNAGNKQQAQFPAQAKLLPNPNGTAMGCCIEHEGKLFILLPGPPRECLPMFNDFVLPLLQNTTHSDHTLLKWRLFGVAESEIAQSIDHALQAINCKTGYRFDLPYIECKVWAPPALITTITHLVEPIVAPYLLTTSGHKASQELMELIVGKKKTITILDDITGGILQTLLQNKATYPLLKFHDCHSTVALHIHLRGLHEYWQDKPSSGQTSFSIFYRYGRFEGKETHNLPHRSAYVVHYAAELICFRLFHLLNQIH